MTRYLYDRLKMPQTRSDWDPDEYYVLPWLDHAELFLIDNVAQYFWEGTDQEHWYIDENFPNLAPPLTDMFFEYPVPKVVYGERGRIHLEYQERFDHTGVLIHSEDAKGEVYNGLPIQWISDIVIFHGLRPSEDFPQGAIVPLPLKLRVMIQPDGTPVSRDHNHSIQAVVDQKYIDAFSSNELEEAMHAAWNQSVPALLSICFMHCKNVTVEKTEPSVAFKGKRNRHNSRPSNTYHVLQIEPMKKVLRSEGGGDHHSIQQALHICRGHFKHFTAERPLFGKVEGTFWWNSQVRGNTQSGVADKDYKVDKP